MVVKKLVPKLKRRSANNLFAVSKNEDDDEKQKCLFSEAKTAAKVEYDLNKRAARMRSTRGTTKMSANSMWNEELELIEFTEEED